MPYLFTYVSHKAYRHVVKSAIANYETQKREAAHRRVAKQQRKEAHERYQATLQARKMTRFASPISTITTTSISSSDSSSSSSTSHEETDSESENEVIMIQENDRATLMHYAQSGHLFDDAASCTTTISAASTIMRDATKLNLMKCNTLKPTRNAHTVLHL